MRPDLPSGTVTFLFTDVEGSTRLLHELGAEGYADALAEHRRVIREACSAEGGVEVDTQGDAFFFAFPTAAGALTAAAACTEALAPGPIQVRVGLHTGTPLVTEEGYVGDDVHLAARIAASAHGAQVVLSQATKRLCGSEPQGITLVDLGEHRLKDISEPVAIYQLGDGTFPPLKTISNTNLPRPASSFLGRERELAEVLERIRGGARLLTLTGPGGTGKTRLAIEAAATLVPEHRAGVFWVGLASLRDPALVHETIAQTLGAKDGLAEHIAERELLLLLDNLEQVIEAAPELASLLESCPNLTLLCTSRELLRVRGEVEYPVPPLAEPEAVSLFCERAQLEPSEEIAELCARLDSLPLAVELAAARTRALSVSQILERLSQRLDLLKGGRDADPRQRTLRATIEWSYDLLSDGEQRLFAALSVFAGGCTLETAEEVCDADLDTLQSLVEKSLLRFTEGRYWMLETIREYAGERLDASGEREALEETHARWYAELGQAADAEIRGPRQQEWLERLAAEHGNLREAITCLLGRGHVEAATRLASNVIRLWIVRGFFVEAAATLERCVAAGDALPDAVLGRAVRQIAEVAMWRGEYERADTLLDRSIPPLRRSGDRVQEAYALSMRAWVRGALGELDDAYALGNEAVEVARESGNANALAACLNNLAEVLVERGDFAGAAALHREALDVNRRLGDRVNEAISAGNLGWTSLLAGDYGVAAETLSESLAIARQLHDERQAASALSNLGLAALLGDEADSALPHFREALALAADDGDPRIVVEALVGAAAALAAGGQLESAAFVLGAADARGAVSGEGGGLPPVILECLDRRFLLGLRRASEGGEAGGHYESGRAATLEDVRAALPAEVPSA